MLPLWLPRHFYSSLFTAQQKASFSYFKRQAQLIFRIFVDIFGVALMGLCLYWVFGDGKRKQQFAANMLIFLWGFMLFVLMVGIVNFVFQ